MEVSDETTDNNQSMYASALRSDQSDRWTGCSSVSTTHLSGFHRNGICRSHPGPVYGMLPGILSNLISGMTMGCLFPLHYFPVQMITGWMAGLVFQKFPPHTGKARGKILLGAGMISLPGTLISSCITAVVFGGITSSGSTILVQLFHHFGMGLTASICLVQGLTDYADRAVVLGLTAALLSMLPAGYQHVSR